MKMGTKSLLFGAHCWFIHPWFVAWAWWKLYGFPWDPRLWVAFVIHDWGYWGKTAMDDEEGENHPEWAANVVHKLFDRFEPYEKTDFGPGVYPLQIGDGPWIDTHCDHFVFYGNSYRWYRFIKYHSRFLSKRDNEEPSKLCYADKLAIALTPWWLYIPMVRLTGEIREYRSVDKHTYELPNDHASISLADDIKWFKALQKFMKEWVNAYCVE